MKKVRFFVLAWLLLGFSVVAKSQSPIEVIYLIPSDQREVEGKSKVLIEMVKNVQRFYADEMERHGFGSKTFQYNPNIRVHKGKHTLNAYLSDRNLVWFEFARTTWLPEYLADVVFMEGIEAFDRGTVAAMTLPLSWGTGAYSLIWIPVKEPQWMTPVLAHELGHVFGLSHTSVLVIDGKRTVMSGASRIKEIEKYAFMVDSKITYTFE